MQRSFALSTIALTMWAASAQANDFESGLQLGDLATPFEVKDVTGPNAGVTLCYR